MQLLSGQRQNAPFWTFEYYQKFFDIETHHVMKLDILTRSLYLKPQHNEANMSNCPSGEGKNHWILAAVAWKELYSGLPSQKSRSLW